MKGFSLFVAVLMLFLVSVQGVQAVEAGSIVVTNCTLSTNSVACGDVIEASCDASVNFGAETITAVDFVVNGALYSGVTTSTNLSNGTWTATIPIGTGNAGAPIVLDSVVARSSSNQYCQGGEDQTVAKCFLEFGAIRTATNACTCTYTTTAGTPQPDNTIEYTVTPSVACVDQSVTTYLEAYDFCDPQWTLSSFTCDINRTFAQNAYNNPFQGTAYAEFTAGNPTCCSQTNLSSDCTPPSGDGTEFVCNQGYFLGDYNDVTATRKNGGSKIILADTTAKSVTKSSLAIAGGGFTLGRQLQPVVFDIDDDGTVEIVTFTNPVALGGKITVYDDELNMEQEISTGRTIYGDAGLFNFDARLGLSSDYNEGKAGAGIAVIGLDGVSDTYMTLYEYNVTTGSLQLIKDVLLTAWNGGSAGTNPANVLCTRNTCATAIFSNTFGWVDRDTLSAGLRTMQLFGAFGDASVDWKTTPVYSNIGELWVVKGADWGESLATNADDNVLIYLCDRTPSGSCTQYINTTLPRLNVSDLYVGEQKDCNGVACSPVYWTELRGKRAFARVSYFGHASKTWIKSGTYEINYPSNDALCVPSPSAAECPADGIGVAVQWGPGSSVVTDVLTLPIEYELTESVPGPLTTFDGGITDGSMGMSVCGEGASCFQVPGQTILFGTNTYTDKRVIYEKNPSLLGFTLGTTNPFINEFGMLNPLSCYVSDGVLGYGYLGGKYMQFVSKLTMFKGEAVPAPNSNFTTVGCAASDTTGTGETKYQGVYAYTYKDDEGWMLLSSDATPVFSSLVANNEVWMYLSPISKSAICDGDRCWMDIIDSSTDHSVIDVTKDGTYTRRKATTIENYNIGGFAKTSAADYFVLYDEGVTTSTGLVVRYDNGAPTTPVTLYTAEHVDGLLGLTADLAETDTVYFAHIPGSTSSLCLQNSSTTAMNDVIFDSDLESIHGDLSETGQNIGTLNGGDLRFYKETCNYKLKKITNGVVSTVLLEEVVKWQSKVIGNSVGGGPTGGLITAPQKYWSVGQFDSNNEFYATYINGLCLPMATYGGTGINICQTYVGSGNPSFIGRTQYMVYERMTPDGTYHPYKLNISDNSARVVDQLASNGKQNFAPCTSLQEDLGTNGTGCVPFGFMTAFANPYVFRTYVNNDGGALFGDLDEDGGLLLTSKYLKYVSAIGTNIFDYIGSFVATNNFVSLACLTNNPSTGAFARVLSGVVPSSSCPTRIITGDVDNDGIDEVFMHKGIYEFTGGQVQQTNYPGTASLALVDFTADTYIDLVAITGSVIATLTSDFELQAAFGANLTLGGLECKYDGAENKITVTPFGVASPNPAELTYAATLSTNAGTEATIPASKGLVKTFTPLSATEYTISYIVHDKTESVSDTCTVTASPTVAQDIATTCSFGADGEFDYLDFISAHNWVGVAANGLLPNNGWLVLRSGELVKYKVEGCSLGVVTIDVKVEPGEDLAVEVFGVDASKTLGARFKGQEGTIRNNKGEIIGEYSGAQQVLKFVFDKNTGTQTIFLDDVQIYVTSDGPATVGGISLGGDGRVDYVRSSTNGERVIEAFQGNFEDMDGQVTFLGACDKDALAAEDNLFDRRQYTNLLLYCASTGNGFCEYNELQKVVTRFKDCTKEAYNYCVYESFPREEGIADATGINGGTTCSALLGTASFWSGVVNPVTNIVWTTLTSNALVALIIFLLLIIILPFATRRR